MVDALRSSVSTPLEPTRVGGTTQLPAAGGVKAPVADKAGPSALSRIALLGAPVDTALVEAIRGAIAQGRYAVDPEAVAARMMDTDLPIKPR